MKNIIKPFIIAITLISPTLIFSAAAAAARPKRPALIIKWLDIQKNAQLLADAAYAFIDKKSRNEAPMVSIEENINDAITLLSNAKATAYLTGNEPLIKEI